MRTPSVGPVIPGIDPMGGKTGRQTARHRSLHRHPRARPGDLYQQSAARGPRDKPGDDVAGKGSPTDCLITTHMPSGLAMTRKRQCHGVHYAGAQGPRPNLERPAAPKTALTA